jgi:dihydrofolate synthase/folylpolyglutamate synthase
LDGGHNPGAGQILADWAKEQKKPIHLICGMLKNKDIEQFLTALAPHVRSLTAIPIDGQNLSQLPSVISDIGNKAGIASKVAQNIFNAIELIVNNNQNSYSVLVCGSLYLAGNILWQNSIGP